jgi:hypothetical protein
MRLTLIVSRYFRPIQCCHAKHISNFFEKLEIHRWILNITCLAENLVKIPEQCKSINQPLDNCISSATSFAKVSNY